MDERAITHWFQYFPNHYMWSQGIGMAIEMIPWGAVAMGEIDQVGQRLKGREGDNRVLGTNYVADWVADIFQLR